MYGTNPFSAQESCNSGQSNGQTWSTTPSIFGALPYPSGSNAHTPLNELVTFRFTSFNPTILNCKVIGPNNETYFRFATDASTQNSTVLKNAQGSRVAQVDWHARPQVEARNIMARQLVGQWLKLSSQRSSRYMLTISGSSDLLARVSKTYDCVVLELTPRAIQLGLLEACILATVLLQCGKNIDFSHRR